MAKKIKELLAMVDVNAPASDKYGYPTHYGDVSDFDDIFHGYLGWSEMFSKRTKIHWVPGAYWLDTDTTVGLYFISLDGEILAMSSQFSRKGRQLIEFMSKDAFHKMRDFYQECVVDAGQCDYNICNLDEIVADGWFRNT